MVQIHLERYPPGTLNKLHAHSARSFKILRKINSNAYRIGLPPDFCISPFFNVEDLVAYKCLKFSPIILY